MILQRMCSTLMKTWVSTLTVDHLTTRKADRYFLRMKMYWTIPNWWLPLFPALWTELDLPEVTPLMTGAVFCAIQSEKISDL